MTTSPHPTSCPCKLLRFSLSLFTASTLGASTLIASKTIKLTSHQNNAYTSLPTDAYGYTPLHYAAQNNHHTIVLHLLSLLTTSNKTPPSLSKAINHCAPPLTNTTPLHRCCYSGAVECLAALLPGTGGEELREVTR